MDYPCVPSLVILVSTVLVLSYGQTDRQTDRITDATKRLSHATVVGDSASVIKCCPLRNGRP